MGRALLLYASATGRTRTIAEAVASHLRDHALRVDVVDAFAPHLPGPAGYDVVILGSHVRRGAYARPLVAWASRHRVALATRPTGVFSVGLAGVAGPRARAEALAAVERFIRATGVRPRHTASVPGPLAWREVPPLLRLITRSLWREPGEPDAPHLDVDATDRAALRRFSHELAADVQARRRPRPPAPADVARGA
jgi:menaquinone-dependent protoporphyrinogen IX oxidase